MDIVFASRNRFFDAFYYTKEKIEGKFNKLFASSLYWFLKFFFLNFQLNDGFLFFKFLILCKAFFHIEKNDLKIFFQ